MARVKSTLELVVFFTSSIPASIPMITLTSINSSIFWQTYLSDPVSVTMEGVVTFIVFFHSFGGLALRGII